jgi:transposase
MDELVLTDAQWAKMEPHCMGRRGSYGRSGPDNRLFVEAVLWIARTGSPWPALPERFGKWHSVYVRFRNWKSADVFRAMIAAAADDPTLGYELDGDRLVHAPTRGRKKGLQVRPPPTRKRIDIMRYW